MKNNNYEEYKKELESLVFANLGDLGVGELLFGLSEVAMSLCAPVLKDMQEKGEFDSLLHEILKTQKQMLKYDSGVVTLAVMSSMIFNLFSMGLASIDNQEHMHIDGIEIGKEDQIG